MEKVKVQICMFVYNLEKTLFDSINNLITQIDDIDAEIYVMCNGCKDNSYNIVKELSSENNKIVPVLLSQGDKAETWNVFVYQYYDRNSIPVFVDGDLLFDDGAIKNIVKYHLNNQHYNAISGFPWLGGRNAESWRKSLKQNHELTGNIYLLSPKFMNDGIILGVRLPIGLIGDDSMIAFLSATNYADGTDKPSERIGVCTDAIFIYDKLNPFLWRDVKLYIRRRIRYSIRKIQQDNIVKKLKKEGIKSMPHCANEDLEFSLNQSKMSISDRVFRYLAIRKLKKYKK